ncbi:MAG TPA: transcriptional regulator [Tahibacter sp.]|nr:transcriptional regulator [Tahibacter sp.]
MLHYRGCGLDNVWLRNGYEETETPYGSGVTIHNLTELHDAIGRAIVNSLQPINGAEAKFLRQELELSQAMLANLLGRDEQAVARWEKGRSKRVDPLADRLIRILYRETKMDGQLKPIMEMLRQIEAVPGRERKFVVYESDDSWIARQEKAA